MPDNKFTLTIKYSAETPLTEEWAAANKVEKVLKDAGKHFGIDPALLGKYKVLLQNADGTHVELDLSKKLNEIEGIEDGTCLTLQPPKSELGNA